MPACRGSLSAVWGLRVPGGPCLAQFEPLPMGSLFVRTAVITAVFFFPIWIMVADDMRYTAFQEK